VTAATSGTRRTLLAGLAGLPALSALGRLGKAATATGLLLAAKPAPARGGAAQFSAWKGGATPPLALKDAKGREYNLAALRGKVVLINFWATWCEPCREEMPSLEDLQERMKGRPFVLLTVNMEESDAKVARFLESSLLQADSLTVLFDRFGTVAKAWKARLLPVSFLVAPDGRIRHTLLGAADWTAPGIVKQIESLLPR
jgi:thiol-disulfide isomerase/thioredoxin